MSSFFKPAKDFGNRGKRNSRWWVANNVGAPTGIVSDDSAAFLTATDQAERVTFDMLKGMRFFVSPCVRATGIVLLNASLKTSLSIE